MSLDPSLGHDGFLLTVRWLNIERAVISCVDDQFLEEEYNTCSCPIPKPHHEM